MSFSGWEISTVRRYDPVSLRETTKRRAGANRLLERQLADDAGFARIYGFSFEGTYYDLPRPVLFLVHGDGELVSLEESGEPGTANARPRSGSPSFTGLSAADFDFADELRVWSYDKADYTIRMDVETGMFEDVLLAAMLGGGPGGVDARGMQARGMQARGMQARGMQARGMQARGGTTATRLPALPPAPSRPAPTPCR